MPSGLYDSADDPAEALAIAEHFLGKWYNGGLSQFFSNWEPEDAALVPVALRIIGFEQGSEIVSKAIAALGSPEYWRDVGHRAMMDFKLPVAEILHGFDRELGGLEESFEKAVAEFERRLAKESGEEMFE